MLADLPPEICVMIVEYLGFAQWPRIARVNKLFAALVHNHPNFSLLRRYLSPLVPASPRNIGTTVDVGPLSTTLLPELLRKNRLAVLEFILQRLGIRSWVVWRDIFTAGESELCNILTVNDPLPRALGLVRTGNIGLIEQYRDYLIPHSSVITASLKSPTMDIYRYITSPTLITNDRVRDAMTLLNSQINLTEQIIWTGNLEGLQILINNFRSNSEYMIRSACIYGRHHFINAWFTANFETRVIDKRTFARNIYGFLISSEEPIKEIALASLDELETWLTRYIEAPAVYSGLMKKAVLSRNPVLFNWLHKRTGRIKIPLETSVLKTARERLAKKLSEIDENKDVQHMYGIVEQCYGHQARVTRNRGTSNGQRVQKIENIRRYKKN